jgi:hypothetical protein
MSRSKRVKSVSNSQNDRTTLARSEKAVDVSLLQSLDDIDQDFGLRALGFFPMDFQTLNQTGLSWPSDPVIKISNGINLDQMSGQAVEGGGSSKFCQSTISPNARSARAY